MAVRHHHQGQIRKRTERHRHRLSNLLSGHHGQPHQALQLLPQQHAQEGAQLLENTGGSGLLQL